jgi:DNA helicase-2/ATP-dependent DNA helicase PcrA
LEETEYVAWFESRPTKSRGLDPLRNLEQLRVLARDYEKEIGGTLGQFLEQTALAGERERDDDREPPVTLLTVHAAKGLEFDSVILVGCEEEILPHVNALRDPDGLEEERRLLHVAMTRARRRLVLTLAERRTRFGRDQYGLPSRFLRELGTESVEFFGGGAAAEVAFDPGREIEREPDPEDPLFRLRPGSAVRHPHYGAGEVVRLRGRSLGLDATAVVRFGDGVERALVLRYSKLTADETGDGDDVEF